MKLISKIFMVAAVTVAAAAVSSCEMQYYEEELYRKEVYIVSGDNNIFGQEFEFGGDTGYLSVYAGGTVAIDSDVEVTLALDYEALPEYNKRNFDQNYDSYALELPQQYYDIENKTVKIEAASGRPYAMCPVKVNINDLLTDQAYFIPLRIESVSDYMASPTKNYVLFQIFLKNDYATTKTDTYYKMNGTSLEGSMSNGTFTPGVKALSQVISATKLVIPVNSRSIRILPGAKAPNVDSPNKKAEARNWCISVTVDPVQTVDIPVLDKDGLPTAEYVTMKRVYLRPFNEDITDVVQVQEIGDKPCYYDPGTRSFTLNYRFKLPSESSWYQISETMSDSRN